MIFFLVLSKLCKSVQMPSDVLQESDISDQTVSIASVLRINIVLQNLKLKLKLVK